VVKGVVEVADCALNNAYFLFGGLYFILLPQFNVYNPYNLYNLS